MIPKNENKTDEMAEILEELQKNYCPSIQSDKSPYPVKVCSHLSKVVINQITVISYFDAYIATRDQLTSERSRKCQEFWVTSDCKEDALLGLQPFAADWHAEANNLEVCM